MFDFKIGSAEARSQLPVAAMGGKGAKNGLSSEQVIPLRDIEGPFARISDGSTCLYVTYPGVALSLMIDAQREEYGLANSVPLMASTADVMAIWWLPERVRNESNLLLCDQRIAELARAVARGGEGARYLRPKLEVLEKNVRPTLAREAVASNSIIGHTFVGFKYFRKTDDDMLVTTRSIAGRISETVKKEARLLCGEREILDFYDLYFKGRAPRERFIGQKVILPDYGAPRAEA